MISITTYHCGFFSGDSGIRTRDLCVANAALSQLSYIPKIRLPDYYIRTADSHYLSSKKVKKSSLLQSMFVLTAPGQPFRSADHFLGCLRKEGISTSFCLMLLFKPEEELAGLVFLLAVLLP